MGENDLASIRLHAYSHQRDQSPCPIAARLLLDLCDEVEQLRAPQEAEDG